MAAPTDDTLVAHDTARDDTVMASEGADTASSASLPRIRATSGGSGLPRADYPTLVEVDPAHYVIERELARGGMGRVLLARDLRLGREVAVKEVLSSSGRVARRFEREARISAQLQHPSIVSVHEAGVWPSGEPFYAMRLVTGRSLDQAIAAAPTYAARLALLPSVLAVADAMAYAHERGVIHRDLKPRNIVVGEFGETVVIDWGLAKELGRDDDSSSLDDTHDSAPRVSTGGSTGGETIAGEVLGTPAYMPPEQANGQPVDARADVYAIGALLYHVLAGVAPYSGEANAEVLAAVFSGPPVPVRERLAEIPGELAAIVERAMARTPAARYPSARDLAEDLRRFQTGRMVGAHRYSLRQLVRRWARRHRTLLIAAAAATALALVVGAVALRRVMIAERTATEERARAISHQRAAEEQLEFMLGDLREKLSAVGKLEVLDDVARRVLAYYDTHADARDANDYRRVAIAHSALAQVYAARNDLSAALAEFDQGEAILRALVAIAPDDPTPFPAYVAINVLRNDALLNLGRRAEAEAAIAALLPIAEARVAAHPDNVKLRQSLVALRGRRASHLEHQGELAEALAEFRRAQVDSEWLVAHDPGKRADKALLPAITGVARMSALVERDLDRTLAQYRLGLEIGLRNIARDPDDPRWLVDVAVSYSEVGGVLLAQGKADQALVEFEAGRAAAERAVAVDRSNIHTRSTLSSLLERVGMAKLALGDLSGAAVEFTASLEIAKQLSAADPTNIEWLRTQTLMDNKLGDVQMKQGDPRGALAPYRAALAIRIGLVERDPTHAQHRRDLFYSHYKIAMANRAIPDPAATRAALTAAIEVAEVTRVAHPENNTYAEDEAESRMALGDELAHIGDVVGARAQYHAALAIAQVMGARPKPDPDWAVMLAELPKRIARPPRK